MYRDPGVHDRVAVGTWLASEARWQQCAFARTVVAAALEPSAIGIGTALEVEAPFEQWNPARRQLGVVEHDEVTLARIGRFDSDRLELCEAGEARELRVADDLDVLADVAQAV